MRFWKILILLLFLLSCASMRDDSKISGTEAGNIPCNFRYVSLEVIFDYIVNNDSEAGNLKIRKEDIIRKIKSVNDDLDDPETDSRRDELVNSLKKYNEEVADIKKDEDYFKSKILNRIDTALENIAEKWDIDIVFNIGEGALYVKEEDDITEEVLKEIIKQKELSAPESR